MSLSNSYPFDCFYKYQIINSKQIPNFAEKTTKMRVIREFPHEDFKITLFRWNEKFLIKYEMGNFEQTYKIPEVDLLEGEQELETIACNTEFLEKISHQFEEMRRNFYEIHSI